MKKSVIFLFVFYIVSNVFCADIPAGKFSNEDIKKLTPSYMEGNLRFENPVFVDVDNDGDFDALKFDNGNVEYYMNKGTLEAPDFVLENRNYDKYDKALFIDPKMPYPMFFADSDGDGDMDLFVVKDKIFSSSEKRFEYKVSSAENTLDLDTGTLITIILVLVIVLLLLAILR
jgi:hypothetical protein